MTELRGVAAALAASLALHAGLAVGLRGLGLGPWRLAPLPPLLVDLGEPVVAVSGSSTSTRRASPLPAAALRTPVEPEAVRGEARRRHPALPPSPGPPAPPTPNAPAPARVSVRGDPRPAPREVAPPPLPVPPLPPAPARSAGALDEVPAAVAPPSVTLAHEPGSAPERSEVQVEEWSGPGPAAPTSAPVDDAAGDVRLAADAVGRAPRADTGAADGRRSRGEGPVSEGAGSVELAAAPGGGESAPSPRGAGDGGGPLVARAGGTGAAVPPEYDLYVQALRRRIQERLAYPWLAVRRRLQGILELDIHLDADGRLTEVAVVSGDGPGPLREAAIRAVREATPFPFPPELVAHALRIRLPVVFELR